MASPMDVTAALKRARDADDLCEAFARKVICVEDDASSDGSCESESGDGSDDDSSDDAYMPMRRYEVYSDSDSDASDAVDSPPLCGCGRYIVPVPDWLPDMPDVPCSRERLREDDAYERFPDGPYHNRMETNATMLTAVIGACGRRAPDDLAVQVLSVMAEDHVRGVLRYDDPEHADAVSRAFVEFVIDTLMNVPGSADVLRTVPCGRGKFVVSYRSWRRLAETYGFRP